MGEVHWLPADDNIFINIDAWYAQTFTPLWSHDCTRLRFDLAIWVHGAPCKVAIQNLKPDGTPTGVDLASIQYTHSDFLRMFQMHTFQPTFPPVRLVKGVQYALVIGLVGINPLAVMETARKKPPSTYPRGKLIHSSDGGSTWDTTDLGDLLFGEYGNPPLAPTPYNPPIKHFATSILTQNTFYTSACTRVGTTEPCILQAFVTKTKPVPVETYRATRGAYRLCLDHYVFKNWESYNQLENGDSLYHTFHIKRLRAGQTYWICFTGRANFLAADSTGPIFEITHPEAPPFTTIRRPNAPGDACEPRITGNCPPCPDHYLGVNEVIPDEEASELRGFTINQWYQGDTYNIADLPANGRPIEQVHLTIRIKRVGGYAYANLAKFYLKINGTFWRSSSIDQIPTSYKNFHLHLYTNPVTGLAWTYPDINSLQIGVQLRHYRGVGWSARSNCTQVYCQIIHQCEAYN